MINHPAHPMDMGVDEALSGMHEGPSASILALCSWGSDRDVTCITIVQLLVSVLVSPLCGVHYFCVCDDAMDIRGNNEYQIKYIVGEKRWLQSPRPFDGNASNLDSVLLRVRLLPLPCFHPPLDVAILAKGLSVLIHNHSSFTFFQLSLIPLPLLWSLSKPWKHNECCEQCTLEWCRYSNTWTAEISAAHMFQQAHQLLIGRMPKECPESGPIHLRFRHMVQTPYHPSIRGFIDVSLVLYGTVNICRHTNHFYCTYGCSA